MGCGPVRRPRHSPRRRPGLRPGMTAPCQELADGETEKTFSTKSGFPEKRGPERQKPRWSAGRRGAARQAARSVPQGMDLELKEAPTGAPSPSGFRGTPRQGPRARRRGLASACARPSVSDQARMLSSAPVPRARRSTKRSGVVRRRTGAWRWRLPAPSKAPALRCSRPRRAVRRIASGARRK
jgi:hypothetical protein